MAPIWLARWPTTWSARGCWCAREQYRHSYPVCWRCGTQVVFRLVDEWFIAMDPLRAELSDSTRRATWLPEGIGLEERELDWLRNMSDWMISKKRYYGLALPIWTCTDCDAWEVIGSHEDAARARRRGLGRVRGPLAASAVDRRGGDRLRVVRRARRDGSSTSATRGWTPASWACRP